eukprot:5725305-Amphidinium_carterae.1
MPLPMVPMNVEERKELESFLTEAHGYWHEVAVRLQKEWEHEDQTEQAIPPDMPVEHEHPGPPPPPEHAQRRRLRGKQSLGSTPAVTAA